MTVSLGNIIAALAFLLGGAGAVWNLRGYLDKIILTERTSFDLKLAKVSGDGLLRVEKAHSRIDEFKDAVDAKIEKESKELKADFVCRNVCKVLHEQNDRNFTRVETKVDSLAVKLEDGIRELIKAMQDKR